MAANCHRTRLSAFCALLSAGSLLMMAGIGYVDDAPIDDRPGIAELVELATEYEKVRDVYWAASRDATSVEEEEEALNLNPDDEFIPKFLAFEEGHRGTDAGFYAVNFVISNAARYGEQDHIASRARVAACDRVAEHYLDHADADVAVSTFRGGIRVPENEVFLRKMAEESPHSHVRAAAWFYLAEWLNQKSNVPQYRKGAKEQLKVAPEDQKEWQRKWLEHYDVFGEVDVNATRAKSIAAARHVIEHFPDERHPKRSRTGPANVLITRDDTAPEWLTFRERAEGLIFETEHLSVGSTSPEITGTDADGTQFRLSDYRGRVVVLMFSANWCGPCKAMYPDNRKLLEELDDQPFVILSVMGDDEVETVQQAHQSGEITWRVWFDGKDGPIATRWNVRGWPTIYVLDHRGIIRSGDAHGESLAKVVRDLLKQRAADPEADELLASHPIRDISTLTRARKAARTAEDGDDNSPE